MIAAVIIAGTIGLSLIAALLIITREETASVARRSRRAGRIDR